MNLLPQKLSSVADAVTAFMRVIGGTKESLRKILLRGEFEEYPDEVEMHCTARMAEMLDAYSKELHVKSESCTDDFLMEEIRVLVETKGIGLPNFLPRSAFLTMLQRKVNQISDIPVEFVEKMWIYVEQVVVRVLMLHSQCYPQLQSLTRRAAHNLMLDMRSKAVDRVKEMVEMEKLTDYTCNPEYMSAWNALMLDQDCFMRILNDTSKPTIIKLAVFGEVEIKHLRAHLSVVQQAFDMKMRLTAYWEIVLRRLVDGLGLHFLFMIQNLVNKEMEGVVVGELMSPYGGGIERMLEESPSVATRREKLNRSIKLLKNSKEVVANIMDRIAASHGDFVD
ncbi:hypothetical protein GIB67_023559 [Kingdonia uniflora]|uniref:GED domain-containing protein n=1 Tax=Kingdonia uniflora TaxID=39325 RepID=A0A7J7PAR2_9MAGN|nr:hypothetical protein GIB67_023559 [Kingdonia uniflora]